MLRYKTVKKPFVITIAGAENSGKTTLAMQLAEHFKCPFVPEYAREYLSSLGRPYDERDLEIIAERQLEAILAAVRDFTFEHMSLTDKLKSNASTCQRSTICYSSASIQNPMLRPADAHPGATAQQPSKILIVDGGMMNIRMWARIKYKKAIPVVEEALKDDVTDLYLLCRPHKEWTPDPLREAPGLLERVWIFNQYLEQVVDCQYRCQIFRQHCSRRPP